MQGSGRLWQDLKSLEGFGELWSALESFRRLWRTLEGSERIWTALEKFGGTLMTLLRGVLRPLDSSVGCRRALESSEGL